MVINRLTYAVNSCGNVNIYVKMSICAHALKNVCPNRCMGSRFILPRFNVIFDIYILDAVSTYIYANELSRVPRGVKARLHQSTTWPPDGFQMLIGKQ